jgi:putative ABC transport system substrate-binding protein
MLVNPTTPLTGPETRAEQDAARSLGLQLHVLNASTESQIETAFGTLVKLRASALVVSVDVFLNSRRAHIVALAARHAVPAVYGVGDFVSPAAGGICAAKILKGAKLPALPVQQVTKVELVINLKTAKTLGVIFPITLLGRADKVIE